MDPTQPPDPDELQFDKAEVAGEGAGPLTCHVCQRTLFDVYFEVNGQPCCEKCRYDVESEGKNGSGTGRFARAFLGGVLGAIAGAGIYYAVLALTGYEVGIVAIVVGFLVGAGVRWGSRGRGGWAYQGLAVALTYVAIVGTYVPLVFQDLGEMDQAEIAELEAGGPVDQAATGASEAGVEETPPLAAAPLSDGAGEILLSDDPPEISAGEALVGLAFFALILLALPFLGGFENIIGIVIIGIGLYQAWGMNKRQSLLIEGPFQVGQAERASLEPVEPAAT